MLCDPDARALYLFPTKALAQDQKDQVEKLITALGDERLETRPSPRFATLTTPLPHVGEGKPSEARRGEGCLSIPVSTYDGDTPTAARPAIRARARLIITNPDMLHTGVLPHHTAWADFFRGLRFVVIDEMHAYRGVFGSHVANVLRRLKRIARFYGAAPQFILTSATLANPAELAERLIEEPVALVDDDGSVRGEKHLLIYNPPVVNRDLGLRR
ncbi:DEAD/DEAH box helicase, partial [bacterium]|nr:DEAD/DEAH box helicase [bacterium]